jgi:hypothetical protein
MKTQHTPGPWTTDNNDFVNYGQKDDQYIVSCQNSHLSPERRRANARLIAAAPDLLEKLSWLIQIIERDGKIDSVTHEGPIEDCKNAIIKATE